MPLYVLSVLCRNHGLGSYHMLSTACNVHDPCCNMWPDGNVCDICMYVSNVAQDSHAEQPQHVHVDLLPEHGVHFQAGILQFLYTPSVVNMIVLINRS